MNAHDGEPSLALLRIVVEVCRSDVYLVGQFRVSLGRVAVQATRALAEHQPHSVKLKLQIINSIFFLIWDVFFFNSHFWSVGINIFRSLSTSHILSSWNFKSITRGKKIQYKCCFFKSTFLVSGNKFFSKYSSSKMVISSVSEGRFRCKYMACDSWTNFGYWIITENIFRKIYQNFTDKNVNVLTSEASRCNCTEWVRANS